MIIFEFTHSILSSLSLLSIPFLIHVENYSVDLNSHYIRSDSYSGHIFEAQEDLEKSDYSLTVIPSKDCTNLVISTADLLLEILDYRLEKQDKRLLFENIRPILSMRLEKSSKTYRNLVDYVATKGGTVKMFDKGKDIEHFQDGDYGVFLSEQGKSSIESYQKIGKRFKLFDIDLMVPREYKTHE